MIADGSRVGFLLGGDHGLSAVVLDDLVGGRADLRAGTMIVSDEHDVERPARDHAGEGASARANGQRLRCIIPSECDLRELALLVVVGFTSIFVQSKASIFAAIDT